MKTINSKVHVLNSIFFFQNNYTERVLGHLFRSECSGKGIFTTTLNC